MFTDRTEFVDFQQTKVDWLCPMATLALSSPMISDIVLQRVQKIDPGSLSRFSAFSVVAVHEVDFVASLMATSTEFVFDSLIFNKSIFQSDTI